MIRGKDGLLIQDHMLRSVLSPLRCRLQWTMDIDNSVLTHVQVEGDTDGTRREYHLNSDGLCMQEAHRHDSKV